MSYARAWQKWFPVIEQGAAGLNERMLQLAELEHARTVLDIGTGIGEPAVSIAQRMGPGRQVIAIDRDPIMIEFARERAAGMGVANVEFDITDIDDFDCGQPRFDVVVARWSLMFSADLDSLLKRLSTFLHPGGRLVAATWDAPERVPSITLARRVARDRLGLEPFEYGPGTAFSLQNPERLVEAMAAAGFDEISCEQVAVPYRFSSVEEYIDNRIALSGPLWDQMETAPEATMTEVTRAIESALQVYREANGSYLLVNTAHCLSGRI
ncbi:MAG: class I SAM-dependent methyltransferase [Gammaproteobacteria bacterium]|nr:MAG: class I SAM-dependent methyltransferase [Gammaproteobacteria bacterium]